MQFGEFKSNFLASEAISCLKKHALASIFGFLTRIRDSKSYFTELEAISWIKELFPGFMCYFLDSEVISTIQKLFLKLRIFRNF